MSQISSYSTVNLLSSGDEITEELTIAQQNFPHATDAERL